MTGSNGILFLLVLYLQPGCYRSQCRSQNDYSNKGLEPQSLPPYANEEIVPYTCRYGRQMPNNSPTSLKCVNGRLLQQQSNWADCQCREVENIVCKDTSVRTVYPVGGGVSFSINIADILSTSYWEVTTKLTFTDINSSSFCIRSSGQHSPVSYDGYLNIKSSRDTVLADGLLWINMTVLPSLNISPHQWQYPCIKNIHCRLVSPSLLGITGNIILSSTFILLTVGLCCSLRACYWRAGQNDKALARQARLKGGGKGSRKAVMVETVPAADQHCRLNNNLENRAAAEDYHNLREKLQYSYHARTPPSRNNFNYNYQYKHNSNSNNHNHHREGHYHSHHHRDQAAYNRDYPGNIREHTSYSRDYPDNIRDHANYNREYYKEYPASTAATNQNHKRKHKKNTERDNVSMTEVWNTAHQ